MMAIFGTVCNLVVLRHISSSENDLRIERECYLMTEADGQEANGAQDIQVRHPVAVRRWMVEASTDFNPSSDI